jgi:hypothetical protein
MRASRNRILLGIVVKLTIPLMGLVELSFQTFITGADSGYKPNPNPMTDVIQLSGQNRLHSSFRNDIIGLANRRLFATIVTAGTA